jgi:hypothetical protein
VKQAKKTLCCLCGKRPATTTDHVPPKCIFPTPRPLNVITVRTCEECNESTSQSDEEFRVFVNLFVGKTSPESEHLWKSHTLSTVRSNRRLLQKALTAFQPGYVTSKHGIILDERKLVVWDDAPNRVLEKIVRALYFHHFKDILGDRVKVIIDQIREIPQTTTDSIKLWQYNCVGGDQFIYRYARANDVPLCSAWLLVFHRNLVILGNTVPVQDPNILSPGTV